VSFGEGVSVCLGASLARVSPWRVGGPCAALVTVHERASLPQALKAIRAQGWKVHLMGAGTRTAFRDAGLAGAVVRLGTGFQETAREGDGLRVGAAVCAAAALDAADDRVAKSIATWRVESGSVGALIANHSEGAIWAPAVQRVVWMQREKEREGTLEEFLKARGSKIVIEVGLRPAEVSRVRRLRPAMSWYDMPKTGKLRPLLTKVSLRDARLRKVLIPAPTPELLVNLGAASAKDLELMHRSVLERVKKEQGVALKGSIRWLGRK